jgi:hypothetical protein
MKTYKLRLTCGLLLLSGLLHAQEPNEKPPLPQGSIIRHLPEIAEWSVVFGTAAEMGHSDWIEKVYRHGWSIAFGSASETGTGASTPRKAATGDGAKDNQKQQPRAIVVTKSGNIFREVETLRDGSKIVCWSVNGNVGRIDAKGTITLIGNGGRKEFWELGWISKKNYTGTAKVGECDCYIFKDKITVAEFDDPVEVTAGVDMKTQLPVYFVCNGEVRNYVFGVQPSVGLTVPEEVTNTINSRQKSVNALLGH